MLKENSVITKRKNVKCTELPDGEAVLLNLENKYFYTLNADAFSIWSRLNGKDGLGAVASGIAAKHGLDKDKALGIIIKQAAELIAEKLAEEV